MSFILDALRKSEARRRLGEAPDLHGGNQGSARPSPRRRGGLMLAVAGLVGFCLFALAGVLYINQDRVSERLAQGSDRESGAGPAVAEPVAGAESAIRHEDRYDTRDEDRERTAGSELGHSELPRERIVSDPAEIDAELARMAARGDLDDDTDEPATATAPAPVIDRRSPTTLQPRTAVVAEASARSRPEIDPAKDQALEEQLERLRQREQTQQPMPSAGSEASAPPQVEPWSPGGAEYIRAWELPLSVRRNMPELKLTIHVYSVDEQNRFVLINGERFVTGEMIRDGARLVDIRREGAVVDFRDYRFLLEP
ncbi:MAG: general secretion pathway protein GspB [Wenzhouxiangella sp.]